MTTTLFSEPCGAEKGLSVPFSAHVIGMLKKAATCLFQRALQAVAANAEIGLFHAFFSGPEGGRKKATYYVREEKVLQVALFPSSHSSTKSQHTSATTSRKLATMDRIMLTLPYPPTVNHYWQTRVLRRGSRYVPQVYVSDDGLRYQRTVASSLNGVPRFSGRLRVQILVQSPDHRARDLDNVLKCLLDSLTKACVWYDDSQVDSLLVVRGETVPGGLVTVLVEPLETEVPHVQR